MKNGGGLFAPKLGGHFELESGGHFKLESGGQYHWNLQFTTNIMFHHLIIILRKNLSGILIFYLILSYHMR